MAKITNLTINPRLEDIVAPLVDGEIAIRGHRVLQYARSIAPVRTGEYRASMGMAPLPRHKGYVVYATARHSVFVEFGTRRMSAHRTLGKSLSAAKGKR